MATTISQSQWTNLPKDLLIKILINLNGPTDLTLLRSIHPSWRTNLPVTLTLPYTISYRPLPLPTLPNSDDPLILLPSTYTLLTSRSPSPPPYHTPFLTRMGYLAKNSYHLFNPFNLTNLCLPFPPISGTLNLFDCNISPLFTTLSLINPQNQKAEPLSKKTVGGWNLSAPYRLALLSELERGNGFVFWKLGDSEFTEIDADPNPETEAETEDEEKNVRVLDIAYHGGKFYAFEAFSWKVGVLNPEEVTEESETQKFNYFPAPDILGESINDCFSVRFETVSYILGGAYFVSSGENLYLLLEVGNVEPKSKGRVLAYVMRESGVDGEGEEKKGLSFTWENVSDLGDQIFFIGYDSAFALPCASKNLPQWKTNSVCLFTRPFPLIFDGCFEGYGSKMPEGLKALDSVNFATFYRYIRMFTMGEDSEGIVHFQKLPREKYTGLFFPPPAYVKWRCPSRGDAEVKLHVIKYTDASKLYGHGSDSEESDDDDDEA